MNPTAASRTTPSDRRLHRTRAARSGVVALGIVVANACSAAPADGPAGAAGVGGGETNDAGRSASKPDIEAPDARGPTDGEPGTQEGYEPGPIPEVPKLDASPPSTNDGVFMAVQGGPPPMAGQPTPFVFVGCPKDGFVETHLYLLTENGKIDRGRYVATFSKSGIEDRVELSSDGKAWIRIEVTEKDSLAVYPLLYRSTVVTEPALLDTSKHSFVTKIYNHPDYTSLGVAFTEKLVDCP